MPMPILPGASAAVTTARTPGIRVALATSRRAMRPAGTSERNSARVQHAGQIAIHGVARATAQFVQRVASGKVHGRGSLVHLGNSVILQSRQR